MNFGRKRGARELALTFLVPFLFWFPIYGLWNLLRGKPLLVESTPLGLLAGTSIHLWFLPFMFVVLLVLNQLKRPALRKPLFFGSMIAAPLLVVTAPFWRGVIATGQMPLGQWVHALPAVLLGIVIGLSDGSLVRRVLVVGATVITVGVMWRQDVPPLFSQVAYLVGMSALLLSMAIPACLTERVDVTTVSGCMMGVYLMHPMALSIFGVVLGKGTLPTATVAFIACTLASLFVQSRIPALHPVVLARPRPAFARRTRMG